MEFFIKDKDGNQQGPIEHDEMLKMIAEGHVFSSTPTKNAIFPAWKTAADFSVLKEALATQKERLSKENPELLATHEVTGASTQITTSFKNAYDPDYPGFFLRFKAAFYDWIIILIAVLVIAGGGTCMAWLKSSSYTDRTSPAVVAVLEQRKAQDEATAKARVAEKKAKSEKKQDEGEDAPEKDESDVNNAFVALNSAIEGFGQFEKDIDIDAVRKGERQNVTKSRMPSQIDDSLKGFSGGSNWLDESTGISYVCVSGKMSAARWCEAGVLRNIFYVCFTLCTGLILLYYGLSLGLWAQTVGMWYWGLLIVRGSDCTKEVLTFRAFIFAILGLIFGITMPFFAVLRKPGIYERVTDVHVIKVAAKIKYANQED